MPIGKITLAALSTLGLTGTGAFCTYEIIKPRNIKDQLKWEGLNVLNPEKDDSSEGWNDLVKDPQDASLKEFVKRNKGSEADSETVDVSKLKETCKKVFLEKNEGKNLEDARKYCVAKTKESVQ